MSGKHLLVFKLYSTVDNETGRNLELTMEV